ncbi:MAG: hypothetical protein WC175_04410 [Candidatus Dojkabacteria bacterium]|jgi:hypothetical protein
MKKANGTEIFGFLEDTLQDYSAVIGDEVLVEQGEVIKGKGTMFLSFDSGKQYKLTLEVLHDTC